MIARLVVADSLCFHYLSIVEGNLNSAFCSHQIKSALVSCVNARKAFTGSLVCDDHMPITSCIAISRIVASSAMGTCDNLLYNSSSFQIPTRLSSNSTTRNLSEVVQSLSSYLSAITIITLWANLSTLPHVQRFAGSHLSSNVISYLED